MGLGKILPVTEDRQRFVAHGLVERDGAYLVLRRRDGRYLGGQWDTPGGTVEAGETPAEAAVRECFEETGLRATAGTQVSHFQNRETEGGDLTFNTVTFRLHLVDQDTEIRLSPGEHDDYRWIKPANSEGLPLSGMWEGPSAFWTLNQSGDRWRLPSERAHLPLPSARAAG